MKAEDIVAKVSAIGGTIRATTRGTLAIGPPAAGIPPDLLADIRQHKPELLAALRMVETDAPQAAPHVAELVAVCEEAKRDPHPPAIDLRKRRDVIAEQPNPPAYVACFLYGKD